MPVRFGLGHVVATPAALVALEQAGQPPLSFVARHAAGDWGELCEQDQKANAEALLNGCRLMSAYTLSDGTRIWVITDAADEDGRRFSTWVLLPEEY